MLADHAHMALGREPFAVKGGDAAGFLATVLQGVQAERRQKAGFMISENSEDAALFTGFVIIVIKMDHTRHAPA
jgi:hypothetical protein